MKQFKIWLAVVTFTLFWAGMDAARAEEGLPKPLAHWTLDEVKDGKIADASGNGHAGALVKMTEANLVEGRVGKALEFKGNGEYVRITNSAHDPAFNFASPAPDKHVAGKSFTIALWASYDDKSYGWMIAFSKGAHPGFGIMSGQNFFQTGGWEETGHGDMTLKLKNTPGGKWEHIAITVDVATNTISAYINGALSNTCAMPRVLDSYQWCGHDLLLGARAEGIEPFYIGKLDDVWLFDVALTADQIKALYNSVPAPGK